MRLQDCPRLRISLVSTLLTGLFAGCWPMQASQMSKIKVQTHYAKTEDGWAVQVDHYNPPKVDQGADPVVLCHGLSYNGLFWDLHEKTSLARYLAVKGYDVWAVSLRGAGLSDQPLANVVRKVGTGSIRADFLATATQRGLNKAVFSNYSVDDHINYDVPAVIKLVKEKSGAQKVHWVGHSMGGMIMFSYLGSRPQASQEVRSFVAVSVPMVMLHPLNQAMQLMVDNEQALKIGNVVPSTSIDALIAKVLGKLIPPTISESLFLDRDNVDDLTLRLLAQRAQESISAQQLAQLLNLAAGSDFYSLDKKVNYTALMGRVKTPTFFLVGHLDNMSTVGSVQYGYAMVSSEDKDFEMFGKINGYRANYGHDDIIIGKHAREEVFPKIVEWLEKHRRQAKGSKLPGT